MNATVGLDQFCDAARCVRRSAVFFHSTMFTVDPAVVDNTTTVAAVAAVVAAVIVVVLVVLLMQ